MRKLCSHLDKWSWWKYTRADSECVFLYVTVRFRSFQQINSSLGEQQVRCFSPVLIEFYHIFIFPFVYLLKDCDTFHPTQRKRTVEWWKWWWKWKFSAAIKSLFRKYKALKGFAWLNDQIEADLIFDESTRIVISYYLTCLRQSSSANGKI